MGVILNNILNFKKTKSPKTKFYEKTAEEEAIYNHHLRIKTKPEDFAKFLPKMENEDLYQLFFHYFCEWHRINCGDSCKGPEIAEYCFSTSKTMKEFFKKVFYYVNQTKIVNDV